MRGTARASGGVRVRRGRRSDFERLRALLPADPVRRERFDRRTLATLGGDVYVAEDAGGEIVGVVAVVYLRSLAAGRFDAVLDTALVRGSAAGLLDELVAFAETRARRRGCRRLAAWPGGADAGLWAVLESRGYRRTEGLAADLGSG